MKFSTLAVALFASTTLVSVASTAVKGGVRGSINQDQAQTLTETGSNRKELGRVLKLLHEHARRKDVQPKEGGGKWGDGGGGKKKKEVLPLTKKKAP